MQTHFKRLIWFSVHQAQLLCWCDSEVSPYSSNIWIRMEKWSSRLADVKGKWILSVKHLVVWSPFTHIRGTVFPIWDTQSSEKSVLQSWFRSWWNIFTHSFSSKLALFIIKKASMFFNQTSTENHWLFPCLCFCDFSWICEFLSNTWIKTIVRSWEFFIAKTSCKTRKRSKIEKNLAINHIWLQKWRAWLQITFFSPPL